MSRKDQRFRNAGAPEGLVFLNYARSKTSLPAADTVDTLVPKASMDALMNGDTAPVFKIEAIDFPAKGSGGVYDGSFFRSFINVTKERPIPGSKRGHEYSSRPASDFYTVGGRIDSQDNGKSGTALLKIYIPPTGDPTENAGFIRDAKAGIVHFSLVTRPDFNVKTEDDGMGNRVQVRHFTATMGAERNDAMEYGGGAMAQLVNSQDSLDFDLARSLIAEGKIDRTTKIDGNPLHNGIVYRSALRSMISRANGQNLPEVAELISLIDKTPIKKNGGNLMEDKNEAISLLSTLIANGKEKITDIAQALGFGDRMRNAQDEANAETVKALNAKLGEKPLEALDSILIENAAAMAQVIADAVTTLAGPKTELNAKKEPVENPAHAYAAQKCAGLKGEALKNAVEGLKKDPVIMALNAQRADGESHLNRVLHNDASVEQDDSGDGIPTTRIKG
jgi:hypothetical protein